jgi:outer membrane lipoprotein-sorting protein
MRFTIFTLAFLMAATPVSFAADNAVQPAAAAPAATPVSAPTSAEQQQAVNDVQEYLNGITTLRARFVQTDNDGKQENGTFYLNRPGKMRIEYDPPNKDLLVADGVLIYYYDSKMKQQSSAPISRSLADFFLRKNIVLSGDISVSDIKHENDTLQMTLVQARNPLAGSLTLLLSEKPLQLLAWRIVDQQGLVTEVRLTGSEMGLPLDSKLFHDRVRDTPLNDKR